MMKQSVDDRAAMLGEYIVQNKATVRRAAKQFGVSKSTVHKDLTERLPQIDHHLAGEVREVLEINKQERHIRGGQATKEKYLQQHHSHFYNKNSGTGSGSHHDQAFFPIGQQNCDNKSRCG